MVVVFPFRSVTVRDSGMTRIESPTVFPARNGEGLAASVQTDSTVEEVSDQPLKRRASPWRVVTVVDSMIVASMGWVLVFIFVGCSLERNKYSTHRTHNKKKHIFILNMYDNF